MAEIVVMPKMNLTMAEGTISQWYKGVGDTIAEEEPLCSIENEKEVEDMNSLVGGTVLAIVGEVGELYPVATPIAIVGNPGEDISPLLEQMQGKKTEVEKPQQKATPIVRESTENSGVRMLPKLRKLIKDKGIDLDDLLKFAGDRKITEQIIDEFAASAPASAVEAGDRVERMSSLRKTIARNMMESCSRTARLTNFMEVDMTEAFKAVGQQKQQGKNISMTAVIIKACAIALSQHEIINTSIDESRDEIIFKKAINISCAVDMPTGLAVPVIRDADKKDVFAITAKVRDFAQRGQEGKLTNEDMSGGTFTVSNVGMLDVCYFTPIINYPQTAILGVGNVTVQPRYVDAECTKIEPRKVMVIGITYDHRVIDGAPASKFLQAVRDALQNPSFF